MGKSLSGKELGKGITQRKNGLYEAKFINRFGKRQTLYGKTVTEITRKLREAQYLDEKQINVADSKMTLDEWFEIWITTCKKIAGIPQSVPTQTNITGSGRNLAGAD